jgi:hypothetical protein
MERPNALPKHPALGNFNWSEIVMALHQETAELAMARTSLLGLSASGPVGDPDGFRLFLTRKVRHGRSGEPHQPSCLRRLLYGADYPLPGTLRLPGAGPSTAAHSAHQCDGSSDRGMGGRPTSQCLPLGLGASLSVARPGSNLWRQLHQVGSGLRQRTGAECAAIPLAKGLRGTHHRHHSPRVPRSSDHLQRSDSVTAGEIIRRILSRSRTHLSLSKDSRESITSTSGARPETPALSDCPPRNCPAPLHSVLSYLGTTSWPLMNSCRL